MRILLITTLTTLLFSCSLFRSPSKQVEHLKKTHPELFGDTVYVTQKIFVPGVKKDTGFQARQKDTVIIKEKQLLMKYFYKNDTVFLKGECKTDTIIKKIPVYISKPETAKKLSGFQNFLMFVGGAGVLIFLLFLTKEIFNFFKK